ncbi:MAG: hypothetical protein L6R35_005796 [Caloplaca aegaea]|nr:MAG: hypothetical protein L6R35_005796 [Caloplaca aegaea]
MNTIRSTWIGWGTLIVAGGGAYLLAKRSINADKAARHEADMKRRQMSQSLEQSSSTSALKGLHRRADHAGSPSTEASHDPAPTNHPPNNTSSKAEAQSKYEAAVPYRAKKGDRFS